MVIGWKENDPIRKSLSILPGSPLTHLDTSGKENDWEKEKKMKRQPASIWGAQSAPDSVGTGSNAVVDSRFAFDNRRVL